MTTAEAQLAQRQQLLAKYKIVASQQIPQRATEEHLKLVARILAAFDGEALRPQGIYAAVVEFTRCYEQFARQLPTEVSTGRVELRIACDAGCHHCCRTQVTVIASEALTIAEFIRERFSAAQMTALSARFLTYTMAADPMGTPASLCPLNEDGLCSVYEVRPFNCRKFHSLDLRACERFFRDRIEPSERLEEPNRADRFGFFWQSAEVAFAALGVGTSDLDFTPALLLALSEPDAVTRLLGGEDVFRGVVHVDP
jgi:hypothetical protein